MNSTPRQTKEEISSKKIAEKRIESKIKLKKAFEDIYSRYSKDFPEADEIDLVQEKVVVDNGFVRNTPVKEIGKLHKNFHVERYNPYRKLRFDDDAFDSILGNIEIKKQRKVKITRVINGIVQKSVKQKLLHLGDLELKSQLDPLTTPVKKLINSCYKSTPPVRKLINSCYKGSKKEFVQKESPLKYEITTPVKVFTDKMKDLKENLETMPVKEEKSESFKEESSIEIVKSVDVLSNVHVQDKDSGMQEGNAVINPVEVVEKEEANAVINPAEVVEKEEANAVINPEEVTEKDKADAVIAGVEEKEAPRLTDDKEIGMKDTSQKEWSCPVSETGSWWDIYEESNSPEYQSRTVVYDSEVDVF
jgi:hypothetical protein